MKKVEMSIQEFCEYVGVNWEDDMLTQIYYEYQDFELSDILRNLPKKYSEANELLKEPEFEELVHKLNSAMNRASNIGLLDEAEKAQRETAEKIGDYMEHLIKEILDIGYDGQDNSGAVKISFDWTKSKEVTVEFEPRKALKVIMEVINGEGIFGFESIDDFVASGPYTEEEAVETHMHYLLNGKLISDIYGFRKPSMEWDVNFWDISKEELLYAIEESELFTKEELDFLEGKLDPSVYSITTRKRKAEKKKVEAEKELEGIKNEIEQLTPAEKGELAMMEE
jgi:hypothetical protein